MAGGAGERFWPLSRQSYPKQLLRIAGSRSMLSAAVERIQPLVAPADTYVITGRALKPAIEQEAGNLPPENVIAEPEGRNTSACLALASAYLDYRYDGEDVVTVVMTADHYIQDVHAFIRDCAAAIAHASSHDALVTFGIRPTRPETGYGYIELGESSPDDQAVRSVAAFREKPNPATANEFLESGRFLWNSGIFVWRNSVLREAFRQALPAAHEQIDPMRRALAAPNEQDALARVFLAMPRISIDYGVLEKVSNVAVVTASFDWDDIGNWGSLARLLEPDAAGNATFGNTLLPGSHNCIVYSTAADGHDTREPVVVGLNLKDTIIVRVRDAVLVLPAGSAQNVRDVVNLLREKGMTEYL